MSLRLLVVRVGAMGDVLHAMPAVAALRAALPEAEIGWAIDPRWEPLLRDEGGQSPLVDAVHAVATRLWKRSPLSLATLRSVAGLRSSLRGGRYDLAIDLQGSIRSAVIGRMAGAKAFAGSAEPREGPARLLYTRRLASGAAHVVEQAAELAGQATGLELAPHPVLLPEDAKAERWWAETCAAIGDRPFAFLVPQAGWGAKQWPAARFGAVAQELAAAGYRVLVNRVGERDAVADEVVRESQGDAMPMTTDLAQLIALTRRAQLVVAGDTGPLHLAAALGRPVVALFGPTDPARTGPFRTAARVLRHAASVTDHARHTAPEGGLLQIPTAAVLEAAFELLASVSPEARP